MDAIRKRFLAGLLALVMAVSLLPAQAIASGLEDEATATTDSLYETTEEATDKTVEETPEETPEEEAIPYYLLITHALELDGEAYGKTEMVFLSEEDFRDGVYDFRQNALDRTGMYAVRGSYWDEAYGGMSEGWTVAKDNFMEGYGPDGGPAYGLHLLIEYEVAEGYEAVVSDTPSKPGEYDTMALASFKGQLDNITFKGVDIITLTLKFEYSRTGGLAGTAAADTATVEVPVTTDGKGTVTAAPDAVTYTIIPQDGFRMLLNPYPLNQFVVDPVLATELTRADYNDEVQARIEAALADGSFAVVPEKVYKNGVSAQDGYTNLYNAAWDLARIAPATETEIDNIARNYSVSSVELNGLIADSLPHDYYHATVTGGTKYPGANSVGENPTLTVEITKEQAQAILDLQKKGTKEQLEDATTVTVYYRRNATSYTVKHWVPSGQVSQEYQGAEEKTFNDGIKYKLVYEESLQGRVGALTNAEDSPEEASFDFTPYVPVGFSQDVIRFRDPAVPSDEGTVIDIRYKSAEYYRVIFNTDYTYIPRELVHFDHSLDLSKIQLPTRTGYTFDGWRYEVRDGNVSGAEQEDGKWYLDVTGTLTFDNDLLSTAVITKTEEGEDDIKALYLYPKWVAADADVRVVFWVEDLSGNPADDVQVSVTGKNASTYEDNHSDYQGQITSGNPDKDTSGYSNVGTMTVKAPTGSKLDLAVRDSALTGSSSSLVTEINDAFTTTMGKVATTTGDINAAPFYSLVGVSVPEPQVAADGSTVINVYYNRNIYSLDFTYYGYRSGIPYIAHNTKGFSTATNTDPDAAGRYGDKDGTYKDNGGVQTNINSSSLDNRFAEVSSTEANFTVPRRITIEAKYGADLQNVWPAAINGQAVTATSKYTAGASSATYSFVSWAATAGPFNAAFRKDSGVESTLMGVYSTMNADIIANPASPGTTHHLYAYWTNLTLSYYRYNHCYEIPQLVTDFAGSSAVEYKIYTGTTDSDKLYLVPRAVIDAYGYNDLMMVKYNNGTITAYEDEDKYESAAGAEYYAVRKYNGSYYAVARRVETTSTNFIAAQPPSDTLNLTKVETNVKIGTATYQYAPDHSSEHGNTDGATSDVTIGGQKITKNQISTTYDLYFYYTREKYTIHYMAPVTRTDMGVTEVELGTITVPYGTKLDRNTYYIALEYDAYNSDYSNKWNSNSTKYQVCPDRSESGTAAWNFEGWYRNRAGTEMMSWDTLISSELYLYAKWTNNGYKVTFDWGGATLPGVDAADVAKYKTQTISANTRFTATGLIPRPMWAGHTLVGWALATVDENGKYTPIAAEVGDTNIVSDGVNKYKAFDFDQAVTDNIHVVAVWTEQKTNNYDYTVWYLCEVDDDYKKADGETVQTNPAGQKGTFIVLDKVEVEKAAYPENTVLWLPAKQFDGYTPAEGNANKSVELTDTKMEYTVVFLYTKNQTTAYTIKFVKESDETDEVLVIEKENITVWAPSVTNDMADTLKELGYQLVTDEHGGAVGTIAGETATYQVTPIVYKVSYDTTEDNFGSTVTPSTQLVNAASDLVKGLALDPTNPDQSNVYEAETGGMNPTRYTVEESFTLKPPTYVQDPVSKDWWKFDGWKLGSGTSEMATARAGGEVYDGDLSVEESVGNLEFLATWVPVTADLTVTNTVKPAVKDMVLPDDAFDYTITLPAGVADDDVLVYRTNGDRIEVTSGTVSLTGANGLKANEQLFIAGPAGNYTVTETKSSPSFNNTDKNYYTLDSIKVGNTTNTTTNDVTATVGTVPVAAEFVNTYHATVWLDVDGDPSNGNTGFPVSKHLLDENGNQMDFFGGNTYTIRVRRGNESPETTPIPNLIPSDTEGSIGLTSGKGDRVINNNFDAVRFTQPGTYHYVFREERPAGTTAVPGVSYDSTRYRVTVEIVADGSDLTARISMLQKLPPNAESDGPDAGWVEVRSAETGSIDLTGQIVFNNTYNETQVDRTFMPTKELEGRGDDRPMAAGEFTFTLTAVGSHIMNQAEAEEYHNDANDKIRLTMLASLNDWKEDSDQPWPENVGEDGKVGNGLTGAIRLDSITYTANDMGGEAYGKVYKYTLKEDLPEGAVNGKYQGITYDQETMTLYVYVHLHTKAGDLVALGDPGHDGDTIVYADVLGDRNYTFTNTYQATPVDVDLGGDPDPIAPNATGASIIKTITGREFASGDEFTFTLMPKDEETPMPLDGNGDPLTELTATIYPESGYSYSVDFAAKITFAAPGIYEYTLTEDEGSIADMEYDTGEKTLTITVTDENGTLTATMNEVRWVNEYTGTGGTRPVTPPPTVIPTTPGTPSTSEPSVISEEPEEPEVTVKLETADHFAYILGKPDGLVHPDDYITRAEVATIFYRLLAEESRKAYWTKTNPYPDVQSGEWYNVAISVISRAGIVNGYDNGRFEPNNNITRGEFAAVAARFLSDPYVGEDYFTDISGHWAREYINRAAAAGWVSNFGQAFRPDDYITRAEVMTLVNAMLGRKPDKDHMHEDMIKWPDNMDRFAWYYEAVQEATNSHEYIRIENNVEEWTEILPVRDWNAIEQEWSDIYDSVNPGDVVDRGDKTK